MTIGCTDIEAILGPLWSGRYRFDPISLPGERGEPSGVWQDIAFTNSWDEPLRSRLGNPEIEEDRDAALASMGIVPMIGFLDYVPRLGSGPAWNLLTHQTAGCACRHPRVLGHFVRLKPSIHEAVLAIARDLYGSLLGERSYPSLDDLNAYRGQLRAVGLDCNQFETFRHLQEGLYPAEIDQATADLILEDKVVLTDLLDPNDYLGIRYMSFFFIAANSD